MAVEMSLVPFSVSQREVILYPFHSLQACPWFVWGAVLICLMAPSSTIGK